MSNAFRVVLAVSLWLCLSLLILSSSESAEPSRSPDPEPPSPKFGGVFRRMLGDNPSTLDPTFLTDIYGGAVVRQIFDGLVHFDAHLKPIPAIAEFWEASRDGRTWTFYLRRGVKFHHGREVTAQDFVYSFTRLLDPKRHSPATDFFRRIQGAKDFMQGKTISVEGLKAIDHYTLRIVLEEPLAPLLAVLGLPNTVVVPQEVVEKQGDRFSRAPVGAGPFKFVQWKPSQEIMLEANDHYYEGRPFLDAVVFKIVVGSKLEERFDEFLKGNLEETIIPSEKTEEVRTDPKYQKYQIFRKPTLSLVYIGFNTLVRPFDDKRVRQAFNYAVNKEAIVQGITRRGSLMALGVLPPGMPGYDPNVQGYGYDPAKARHLLVEAGYPNGADFPVVQLWSVFKAESTKAELAAYQRYLVDLGVKVEIHFAPDWPTYRAMLEHGKLSMFLLSWFADIPDPDNFFYPLLHSASPTNRTFYRDPGVDQMLEHARRELDEARRIALYREAERLVMADPPWITHYYPVFEYLYQPYVQGVEISLLGERAIPLKKIWFKKGSIAGASGTEPHVQPSR